MKFHSLSFETSFKTNYSLHQALISLSLNNRLLEALRRLLFVNDSQLGAAIAAKMPTIAITTKTSINVNPKMAWQRSRLR